MSHVTRVRVLLPFLIVLLTILLPGSGTSLAVAQPSPDESLLRAAVGQYFELFAKKDQNDLLKYWSADAPERGPVGCCIYQNLSS